MIRPPPRSTLFPYTPLSRSLGLDGHGADVVNRLALPAARFTTADMNAPLPFGDGTFDAVVCIDGIEHLERPLDRKSTRLNSSLTNLVCRLLLAKKNSKSPNR